ncbi:MAG: hypothetical protein AAFX09_13175, partial [Pseudomonadota bacterium]
MSTPRWLTRLTAPGARLFSEAGAYAVWAGGDRRRRPTARLTMDAFTQARSAGLIEPDGEGWAISEAGRAHLKRAGSVSSENPFADQHRDLGPH